MQVSAEVAPPPPAAAPVQVVSELYVVDLVGPGAHAGQPDGRGLWPRGAGAAEGGRGVLERRKEQKKWRESGRGEKEGLKIINTVALRVEKESR